MKALRIRASRAPGIRPRASCPAQASAPGRIPFHRIEIRYPALAATYARRPIEITPHSGALLLPTGMISSLGASAVPKSRCGRISCVRRMPDRLSRRLAHVFFLASMADAEIVSACSIADKSRSGRGRKMPMLGSGFAVCRRRQAALLLRRASRRYREASFASSFELPVIASTLRPQLEPPQAIAGAGR